MSYKGIKEKMDTEQAKALTILMTAQGKGLACIAKAVNRCERTVQRYQKEAIEGDDAVRLSKNFLTIILKYGNDFDKKMRAVALASRYQDKDGKGEETRGVLVVDKNDLEKLIKEEGKVNE